MAETGLWHVVKGNQPTRLLKQALPSEADLESWIFDDPTLISSDLRTIRRQVQLGPKWMDLLCVEEPGVWVVCELKKIDLERESLAQAIDYVARLEELGRDDFEALVNARSQDLDDSTKKLVAKAFEREANGEGREIRIVLAGVGVKAELQRMVDYLAKSYGVPVAICTFSAVSAPDGEGLILMRDITEENADGPTGTTSGLEYSQRLAAVRQHFEEHGQADIFDGLVEAFKENSNLYVRPWKKAIMVAPNQHHGRYLMYFTPRGAGVHASIGKEAVLEFFQNIAAEQLEAISEVCEFTNRTDAVAWAQQINAATGDQQAGEAYKPRGEWNGKDWYVSFGECGESRRWEDAVRLGFISAGGGDWYARTLVGLPVGARVFVNIPGVGYVGAGVTTGPAVKADESFLAADQQLIGVYKNENGEPEYIVPVDWIKTVERSHALSERGLFGNQNSACRLSDTRTLERLYKHFLDIRYGENQDA